MAIGGKNASFSFGGTLYDSDDCLQSWALNHAIGDIVYQCNGFDEHALGTKSATFQVSLALNASDTTKVSALDAGSTGAFEAHPAGDTSGYIEITAVRASVITSNITTGPNSIVGMDITIALDDITFAAAT